MIYTLYILVCDNIYKSHTFFIFLVSDGIYSYIPILYLYIFINLIYRFCMDIYIFIKKKGFISLK